MEPSQLVMYRRNLDDVPSVKLPAGYHIRFYEEDDDRRLAEVFRKCFDPGWSPERVAKTLVEDAVWSPNRVCVLCHGKEVVGTASAWEDRERPRHGMVHCLAVLPAHREKKQGLCLTARVLDLLKSMGYEDAWLPIDDLDLDAVKTCLELGFKPVFAHPSHAERWEIIRHKLEAASSD
jgi:N-acetylglutamate synthase-like GNAT family acetyltransferase